MEIELTHRKFNSAAVDDFESINLDIVKVIVSALLYRVRLAWYSLEPLAEQRSAPSSCAGRSQREGGFAEGTAWQEAPRFLASLPRPPPVPCDGEAVC